MADEITRLYHAQKLLDGLKERVRFDRLEIRVSDDGRHWQFMRGTSVLLDFWPATAKARPANGATITGVSPKRATALAIGLGHVLDEAAEGAGDSSL